MFSKLQIGTGAAELAHSGQCSGNAKLVLFQFSYKANKFNIVQGTPVELARLCHLTLWQFNQGVQGLKNIDIIRKYTKKEYMINPDISYNGDDTKYHVIKHMWDNQTTSGFRNASKV